MSGPDNLGPQFPKNNSNRKTYGDSRPSASKRREIRAFHFQKAERGGLGGGVAFCALGIHPNCHVLVDSHDSQLDRKKPGDKGGKYTKRNTQLTCPNCNRMRSDKLLSKLEIGKYL